MTLTGYICNTSMGVETPMQASHDPEEAVRSGDAYRIYKDSNGIKWFQIGIDFWVHEGNEKVYSRKEWEEAHDEIWAKLRKT